MQCANEVQNQAKFLHLFHRIRVPPCSIEVHIFDKPANRRHENATACMPRTLVELADRLNLPSSCARNHNSGLLTPEVAP
ncbi:hypothetical protein JMJ77_0015012 [Colletotrichum scovillei]|uniref:Uncharacterized protein n=1 Tax=Colletotrichum scovillei TaxID=1209932 RepID=A0A9P7UCH5_9PEZI|nr:hypothetical protein JMJ77_0015012 [Colletotrichum scovillei]KAG7056633.1 hypothetical protein JMJ78_0000426 [Colletotrichum scovillei]KAG7066558.1 hypothetical protein JMJ76_0000415 [Colletotrichum scovillei]